MSHRSSNVIMVLATLAATVSPAAGQVWDGAGSPSANWSVGTNWNGGVPVGGANTAVTFAGTTNLSPNQNISDPFQLNSVLFDSTAGAFTLSGGALNFTTTSGSVAPTLSTANSAVQTVNNNLTLTNNLTVAFTGASSALGSMTLGGIISGAGSLTTNGILDLTLNGVNTYMGGTVLNTQLTSGSAYTYTVAGVTNALPSGGSVAVKSGLLQIGASTTQTVGNLSISDPSFTFPAPAANVYLQGGATLNVNFLTYQPPTSFVAVSMAQIVSVGATPGTLNLSSPNIQVLNGGILQIESNVTGTSGLSLSGAGQLQLGFGVMSYAGPTTVQGPTLTLLSQNVLPRSTAVNLVSGILSLQGVSINQIGVTNNQLIGSLTGSAGSSVQLNGNTLIVGNDNTSTTFSGAIQDDPVFQTAHQGALFKVGTGTLTLANTAASNSQNGTNYLGGTTIVAGTLQLGAATGLPAGGPVILAGGTLDLNGFKSSIGTISGTSGTINLNGGTLTITNSGTQTLGVNINSTGGGKLVVSGSGDLFLTGTDTISGGTTVSGGTLHVGTAPGNATLNGPVTVDGATSVVKGVGNINGMVSAINGGTIGVGNSPGILTVTGPVSFASGTKFHVDLDGPTAGNGSGFYGQLVVNGAGNAITLGGATLDLVLSYNPTPSQNLFILDNETGADIIGTFAQGNSITVGGYTAQIGYFGNPTTGTITGGHSVVLSDFVAVPEPGSIALLTVAAAAGWRVIRRRTVPKRF